MVNASATPIMKQIPLAIGPDPLPTFDSFLPGANGAAVEHLRRLAMPSPPVYLWGPAGSGKTHLLRALAHACQQGGQRVGWFDASDTTPWPLSPDWSLIIIDRCDELDGAAQQAAFTLFVEAATEGVQVAAAGRLPPVDLVLRDDLRTRLGWGPVFAMQPLDESETRAALRGEGHRRGILLSDEVMDHLLTRFPRDLKHLMALLDRLDDFALSRSRAVTVPLVKAMLAEEGSPQAALRRPPPEGVEETSGGRAFPREGSNA
jgi:DnaA family protein